MNESSNKNMKGNMSNTSHTPGPWVIRQPGEHHAQQISVCHSMGKMISGTEMFGAVARISVSRSLNDKDKPSAVEQANAQLIAAAPELLEACIELSGLVQVLRGDRPLADSQGETLIRASNAIAKAMFNFANPNAGAPQAYPAGRWTGGAK